jgi:drug/metabolite transporter superfamily protein YnfA
MIVVRPVRVKGAGDAHNPRRAMLAYRLDRGGRVVAAVEFGAAVFGHVPDLWTMMGMTLIVLAGIHVLRRQPARISTPVQS